MLASLFPVAAVEVADVVDVATFVFSTERVVVAVRDSSSATTCNSFVFSVPKISSDVLEAV